MATGPQQADARHSLSQPGLTVRLPEPEGEPMKRVALLVLATVVALAGCGGPRTSAAGPRLNGTYSGVVYSSGYAIGAMAVDVTTSSGQLSGAGCFVALDYSTACNSVSGTIYGTDATFRIGGLRFSGRTNGNYIDTTFRSDDGTVSGRVYFTQDTSAAQASSQLTGGAEAGRVSAAFSESLAPTGQP
jgi:hypothetical protein